MHSCYNWGQLNWSGANRYQNEWEKKIELKIFSEEVDLKSEQTNN